MIDETLAAAGLTHGALTSAGVSLPGPIRHHLDVAKPSAVLSGWYGVTGQDIGQAFEAAGQVSRFAGWTEWSSPRFEINSAAPVQIGVDGEALTMDPPAVFVSRPGALRVRLPRYALHLSPAARTVRVLSGSTLAELGRVAMGRADPG